MRPAQEEEKPPVPFAADTCLSSGFGLELWPLQVRCILSVGAELQLLMTCIVIRLILPVGKFSTITFMAVLYGVA